MFEFFTLVNHSEVFNKIDKFYFILQMIYNITQKNKIAAKISLINQNNYTALVVSLTADLRSRVFGPFIYQPLYLKSCLTHYYNFLKRNISMIRSLQREYTCGRIYFIQ